LAGLYPDPAGGAYSAPPDPLAGLRGPSSKGEGREKGKGKEGKGGTGFPLSQIPRSATEKSLNRQYIKFSKEQLVGCVFRQL